jgi:hypothetical protein
MRANRGLRSTFLVNLLLTLGGCAIGGPVDTASSDPPTVREYPTGSNILRRDRGVPSEVKVYGKDYAEEMMRQANQVPPKD